VSTDINDINGSSENESIGLTPLTIDEVRNFFNTYIKPFSPYQDEKVYDTIINNLTEYYHTQMYLNVPSKLKQLYEEANFDSLEIYNLLLIAIGVPAAIINTISFNDKIIFLKTFSDFERHKGTISFFKKVGEAFGDKVSIYELFIDLEDSVWVFKPVMIYLNSDMILNTTSIPYETVQNYVPSLLLNTDQLDTLYEEEKVILPIKSNLILLDNDMVTNISVIYDVIVAIFLHTYKDNYIDLYFKDTVQAVQLKTIYFLWYYLLTDYNEISWTAFNPTNLLRFTYDDIGFPSFIGTTPTTIENLSLIIDRYTDIGIKNTTTRDVDNSLSERDELYKDISTAFYIFTDSSATTLEEMYDELKLMNMSLISYIDDRILNTSIGIKAEINLILSEIYSSLILYASGYNSDIYFSQYVDYFLKYLPQIRINPEDTVTHTIIYNLKPFHVELYNNNNIGLRIQDKFDQIFIDDEKESSILFKLIKASALSFSDEMLFEYEFTGISDITLLEDNIYNLVAVLPDSNFLFNDEMINNVDMNKASSSEISENVRNDIIEDTVSDMVMRSVFTVTKVP